MKVLYYDQSNREVTYEGGRLHMIRKNRSMCIDELANVDDPCKYGLQGLQVHFGIE